MPKNGKRGANTRRPNAPFASNNEEIDSNVIFGDAKTKKKAERGSTAGDSSKKGDTVTTLGDDPPKKPDTRKLVSKIQKLFDCCQDDSEVVNQKRMPSLIHYLAQFLSKY